MCLKQNMENIIVKSVFLTALFFCLCVFAASSARAAQIVAHDVPKVSGNVVKAVRYADATGDNLVLLTETEKYVKPDRKHPREGKDKELFAYRFLLHNNGSVEQVWQVADYVYDCELDGMNADFDRDAFRITDLDKNGVAEIWMTYALGCRGDPGPMTMKIVMYEGGKKYAVRGETRSRVTETEYAGGGYTPDAAFASGPAEFAAFAKQLWEHYKNKN